MNAYLRIRISTWTGGTNHSDWLGPHRKRIQVLSHAPAGRAMLVTAHVHALSGDSTRNSTQGVVPPFEMKSFGIIGRQIQCLIVVKRQRSPQIYLLYRCFLHIPDEIILYYCYLGCSLI